MFIPQVVLAILASAFGSRLARRLELRGVLLLGLCGDLLSMAVLAASPLLIGTQAAFVALCVATGALGLGFGATVMALNTLVEGFFPEGRGWCGAAAERVARRRYGAGAAAGGTVHRAGHLVGIAVADGRADRRCCWRARCGRLCGCRTMPRHRRADCRPASGSTPLPCCCTALSKRSVATGRRSILQRSARCRRRKPRSR